MCWQSCCPATFICCPSCPCHPRTSLFPPVCDCTLSGSSLLRTESRVTCAAICSLLPCTARVLCCSCPRRGSATVTYTAPLPHLFTRSVRLRVHSCPTIRRFLSILCRLPLSFTSVLALKSQCRLEFLGLGVFYRFRGSSIAGCHRGEGSSGPSRGTPRSQPKPASDTVNPSRERAKS